VSDIVPVSETALPVSATFIGQVTGSIRLSIKGVLRVKVEPPEGGGTPPPVFVVGETYPDETTVGAGIIRPYPTNVILTPTTYTGAATEPIVDTVFEDLVTVDGQGYVFENCVFRGPATRTTGSNLVNVLADSSGTTFRYCDINPQTASSYWNGIGYKRYRLEQCHVWGCTDAFAAFALADDPDPSVDVKIIGTWAEKLSQFKPDVAGNRDVTHNDVIQCQGNVGPDDDILIDGSRFDAYHSVEQSSPTPPEHTQISAVMMTPSGACQDRVCLTARRSWFTGGIFTLNATSTALGQSVLVLEDNIWEKPNNGVPAAAIAIDPVLTKRTVTGNVYEDGSPVSIYNA